MELKTWLISQNINLSQWGHDNAKRVTDLWQEVKHGETVLRSNPTQRCVRVVSVLIQQKNQRLFEVAQRLQDGRTRYRNRPPSEKMLPHETAESAAIRCLQEELGVTAEQITILNDTYRYEVRHLDSPSYPGLPSKIELHTIMASIPSLPSQKFTTQNIPSSHDPVRQHVWAWQSLPSDL